MITLELLVSGSAIGSKLAANEEAAAFALQALMEDAALDFGHEVAFYLRGDVAANLCAFLRQVADAIEGAEA